MLFVVMAAALGAFGGGPLTRAAAAVGEDLRVEYPRVARARSPSEISVDCAVGGIWISRAYLDNLDLAEVRPPPAEVSVDDQRTYFSFLTRDPVARLEVDFTVRPRHAGTLRGSIGCRDDVAVDVRQFVFP